MLKTLLSALLCIFIILILSAIISPLRYIVPAWLRGESFYGGRPMSYWIEALGDQDVEARRQATSALGLLGPKAEKAVPTLIRALEDPDGQVRWGAAEALGEVRRRPKQAVPALSRMMSGGSTGDRVWAATGLGLFGPDAKDAVATLASALDDESPSVRSGAAWALGRIGPDAKSAVPKLLEKRGDGGPAEHKPYVKDVGEMACAALWVIDPDSARKAGVPLIFFPWDRFGQDEIR